MELKLLADLWGFNCKQSINNRKIHEKQSTFESDLHMLLLSEAKQAKKSGAISILITPYGVFFIIRNPYLLSQLSQFL